MAGLLFSVPVLELPPAAVPVHVAVADRAQVVAWSPGLARPGAQAGLRAAIRWALDRHQGQASVSGRLGTSHAPGDTFGTSVAISGSIAVVGASGAHNFAGAAYVFARSGKTWHQQAILTARGSPPGGFFGSSVAVSGTTVVIGAECASGCDGAAYVFGRHPGGIWSLQATLADPGRVDGDNFGASVAVFGTTAVVGAPGEKVGRGVAYVFARLGPGWSRQAALAVPGGVSGDSLGESVALSGGTVVVGAPGVHQNVGAAYVFGHYARTWRRQAALADPSRTPDDRFGGSVAISDTTIVVGAYGAERFAGMAYVFARAGRAWLQQARLATARLAASDFFGWSVAVSGARVLIGVPRKNLRRCGVAYEFASTGGTWRERAQVVNPGCAANDFFGASVALSGTTAVIGAPYKDKGGAVYEITLP